MELIIDFDSIKDPSKKEWLRLHTLKLMGISFQATNCRVFFWYNRFRGLKKGY